MPQVGEILMRYFKQGNYRQYSKGVLDMATDADNEADKFLREALLQRFPDSALLTEETAPEDFLSFKDAENLWVIDPCDGSGNFSRGHPNFAMSVALVQKGVTSLGVVYIPAEKNVYWAQADVDTAMLDDQPIRVSRINDLSKAVFLCDWYPTPNLREWMISIIKRIAPHVRQIKSMGSAVEGLCEIASGRADVYMQPGLKPWDLAATSLIIAKAGGKITRLDGSDWDIFTPEIFASNNILHTPTLKLVS